MVFIQQDLTRNVGFNDRNYCLISMVIQYFRMGKYPLGSPTSNLIDLLPTRGAQVNANMPTVLNLFINILRILREFIHSYFPYKCNVKRYFSIYTGYSK